MAHEIDEYGQIIIKPPVVHPAPRPATEFATLIIRRKKNKDQAPRESIKIRTRSVGSSERWARHGSLDPGDVITIKLEPDRYCVRARVGSTEDRDKEDVEIHMVPNSTVKLVTHAWVSPQGYLRVDIHTDSR